MSSGPWTIVDGSMCGAGAAPRLGYMNGSCDDIPSVPRGHIFEGLLRLSSLSTGFFPYSVPLTERLERCEGLFLDLAPSLFFGGDGSGSGELPEDNSSSAGGSLSLGRMGSLPLFCLTGGAGGMLPRAFSRRSSSKRARR